MTDEALPTQPAFRHRRNLGSGAREQFIGALALILIAASALAFLAYRYEQIGQTASDTNTTVCQWTAQTNPLDGRNVLVPNIDCGTR